MHAEIKIFLNNLKIMAMKRIKFLTGMLIVVLTIQLRLNAQTYKVTGTILDNDGNPMVGATFSEKGTINAVTANENGHFEIKANLGSVIKCEFLGFKDKEFLVEKKNIDKGSDSLSVSNLPFIVNLGKFALDLKTIDIKEVFIQGAYIRQKPGDNNGAVSSLSGEELTKVPAATLDNAMAGKLSGVLITQNSGSPGAGSTILIRGIGSINAGTQPLFVIDGMPVSNQGFADFSPLATINPNDIEYIDVLKDASSCAIFGARGSNGVIIIRTKRCDYSSDDNGDPKEKVEYPGDLLYRCLSSGIKKIFSCNNE